MYVYTGLLTVLINCIAIRRKSIAVTNTNTESRSIAADTKANTLCSVMIIFFIRL